ncbi:MAG: hypothetical protein MRY59_05610 [Aquisalinus sp.]|nr:hypothetical protein [Aquisalinus sp.]
MAAVNYNPITQENIEEAYEGIFAPWVKDLGLCNFRVDHGFTSARLPISDRLKFSSGAVCGQALMAVIDTVTAIAMGTTERTPKGTVYADAKVTGVTSGKMIAHAVLEFAF